MDSFACEGKDLVGERQQQCHPEEACHDQTAGITFQLSP